MNVMKNVAISALAALGVAALCSCAVDSVGVGVSAGYDGGYYEPYGYDYGGWGGGYLVGPGRRGNRGDFHRGGGHPGPSRAPAYHPAPAGRGAPSIPSGPRGHR